MSWFSTIKPLVLLVAVIAVLMGCEKHPTTLPYFNDPSFTPIMSKRRVTHRMPDFSLTNQDALIMTREFLRDRIVIAHFFYTACPTICRDLTYHMSVLNAYYMNDPQVLLVSHTMTPEIDTPAVLKNYIQDRHIDDHKWQFLTGTAAAITRLAIDAYFFSLEEGIRHHSEIIYLVDPEGYIRGVYNGSLRVEVKRIKRHLQRLKDEFG